MSDSSVFIEKFDAWQTPIFSSAFPDHHACQKALLDVVYAQKAAQTDAVDSQVAVSAKHGLFESTLDFLDDPSHIVQELVGFLKAAVEIAAYEANAAVWPEEMAIEVDIVESWYHVTKNGGYHDAHSHPNCSWCGIYYLDAGDCSYIDNDAGEPIGGLNRFYHPRTNAGQYRDIGSQYISEEGFWDITPADGQCVIFPSYLTHSAMPYFGRKDRVVIAFNCQLREKLV